MKSLLLLFIVVPIAEMWLLIEVGARIGALPTIALVFLTAAIGLALLRQQGLSTLLRVDQRMAQGQLPAHEIIEGMMLAVGGALLLTPGFITDIIGFACLIPITRKWLVSRILKQHIVTASYGRFRQSDSFHSQQNSYRTHSTHTEEIPTPNHTIDGEFRRED